MTNLRDKTVIALNKLLTLSNSRGEVYENCIANCCGETYDCVCTLVLMTIESHFELEINICWYIGLMIDIMDTYYCSISSYISSGLYGHWYSLCPYVKGISIIQHMFNINFVITTIFVISMSFTYFMFVLCMCLQTSSPFLWSIQLEYAVSWLVFISDGNEEFVDQWKVLIYDEDCRDVISPVMNVGALRLKGVTLHLMVSTTNHLRLIHSYHTSSHSCLTTLCCIRLICVTIFAIMLSQLLNFQAKVNYMFTLYCLFFVTTLFHTCPHYY